MSKVKPVSLRTGAMTNEERIKRINAEDTLKGNKQISQTPPTDLCSIGKDAFMEIIESLPTNFLNNTDVHTVSIVADAIANMQKCRDIIKKEGLIVEYTNNSGAVNKDQNKAILIYQKYSEIFHKFASELGLSPSARSKLAFMLNEEIEKESDPLLRILGRT
ncbi:phage terminase small subunit P27 family [Neobacillus drentensis]|uniref:phage terminase small subunit P27 family n=1 Tax=Neobacillus drentensis TaxID=220684 RepID=UPI002FFEB384